MKHNYPAPYVVDLIDGQKHTHTCILLHGLGSNGPKFGDEFLAARNSHGKTIREIFPFMKFIFPTAKKRRSTAFKRAMLNQWFDIYSLEDRFERNDVQIPGLRESTEVIHDLITIEAEHVPLENITLGGLSNGYAASVYALLTFDKRIGTFIGMSGWFPYVKDVKAALSNEMEDDGLFGYSSEENDEGEGESNISKSKKKKDPRTEAIDFMRENIDLDPINSISGAIPVLDTPVFLGHGEEDEKLSMEMGQEARDAIVDLGLKVTWKAYPELGHWYKIPDEIDDIIRFLEENLNIRLD